MRRAPALLAAAALRWAFLIVGFVLVVLPVFFLGACFFAVGPVVMLEGRRPVAARWPCGAAVGLLAPVLRAILFDARRELATTSAGLFVATRSASRSEARLLQPREKTMPIGRYRLTVVGCALSWLLVGTHLPTLQHIATDMTHQRSSHDWLLVAMTALLVVAGIAGLWMLLRSPGFRTDRSDTGSTAA